MNLFFYLARKVLPPTGTKEDYIKILDEHFEFQRHGTRIGYRWHFKDSKEYIYFANGGIKMYNQHTDKYYSIIPSNQIIGYFGKNGDIYGGSFWNVEPR